MAFKKVAKSSIILAVILILFLFNGFNVITKVDANNQSDHSSYNYTGADYYKGLVFGLGDVGKVLIDDEKKIKALNNPKNRQRVSNIVSSIKEDHPSYFKDLQSAINLKDPSKTLKLLQDSRTYIEWELENDPSNIGSPSCIILICSVVTGPPTIKAQSVVIDGPTIYANDILEENRNTSSAAGLKNDIASVLKAFN